MARSIGIRVFKGDELVLQLRPEVFLHFVHADKNRSVGNDAHIDGIHGFLHVNKMNFAIGSRHVPGTLHDDRGLAAEVYRNGDLFVPGHNLLHFGFIPMDPKSGPFVFILAHCTAKWMTPVKGVGHAGY